MTRSLLAPTVLLSLLVLSSVAVPVAADHWNGVSPPDEQIHQVGVLYWTLAFLFGGSTIFAVVFLAVRASRRRQALPDRDTPLPGQLGLGLMGIVVVAIVGVSTMVLADLGEPPSAAITQAQNVVYVDVTGAQWVWMFEHDGVREVNELHLPEASLVIFRITSVDVIHSFYMPDFNMKEDAVPGKVNTLWILTDHPAEYITLCTQFCGTAHAQMLATVKVLSQHEYDMWYAGQQVEEVADGRSPSDADLAVEVSLHEWAVDMDRTVLPADSLVAFHVTNTGTMVHNVTFAPYAPVTSPALQPGEEAWVYLETKGPDTFEAWCAIPGHRQAGMTTTVTVEGA